MWRGEVWTSCESAFGAWLKLRIAVCVCVWVIAQRWDCAGTVRKLLLLTILNAFTSIKSTWWRVWSVVVCKPVKKNLLFLWSLTEIQLFIKIRGKKTHCGYTWFDYWTGEKNWGSRQVKTEKSHRPHMEELRHLERTTYLLQFCGTVIVTDRKQQILLSSCSESGRLKTAYVITVGQIAKMCVHVCVCDSRHVLWHASRLGETWQV